MPSQPISARPLISSPEFEAHRHALAIVGVIDDTPVVFQRDAIAALAGLQIGRMQIGTVGQRIGLAEPLEIFLAERNLRDQFAGERVAHFLRRRDMRVGQHLIPQAKLFQRAKDVRSELDAGADLAEFLRLLEQADRKALARERIGGGQSADAAARNEDREVVVSAHRAKVSAHSRPRSGRG